MPAYRHQIDALVVDVDGDLADRLSCVRVEEYLVSPTQSPYLPDRLLHADLVVHCHDRDEDGVRSDRFLENLNGIQAEVTSLVYRIDDTLIRLHDTYRDTFRIIQ